MWWSKTGAEYFGKAISQVQEDFYDHDSWFLHLIISGEY